MKQRMRSFRCKIFGKGFPIVLIPGLDGLTELFADIVPELSRYYRVIVYYLPLLAEAKNAGREYTSDFIAADLKKILDEQRVEKTHIIGESFGGLVTQAFALNYPELVEKLILISSASFFNLPLRDRLLAKLVLPWTPQWVVARLFLPYVCEPHEPKWAKDLFVREASWADQPSVVARTKMLVKEDFRDRVAAISAPTLLVVGGADRFTGEVSKEMLKLLPNGEIVEIPQGGHLCHMTNPTLFLDAVFGFLGKSDSI